MDYRVAAKQLKKVPDRLVASFDVVFIACLPLFSDWTSLFATCLLLFHTETARVPWNRAGS